MSVYQLLLVRLLSYLYCKVGSAVNPFRCVPTNLCSCLCPFPPLTLRWASNRPLSYSADEIHRRHDVPFEECMYFPDQ
jgi:hypothetical protein